MPMRKAMARETRPRGAPQVTSVSECQVITASYGGVTYVTHRHTVGSLREMTRAMHMFTCMLVHEGRPVAMALYTSGTSCGRDCMATWSEWYWV